MVMVRVRVRGRGRIQAGWPVLLEAGGLNPNLPYS